MKFDTQTQTTVRQTMTVRSVSASALIAGLLFAGAAQAASPAAAEKADPAKGQAIAAAVCAACHNPDGNSTVPSNPILAGQHAAYLNKQLMNFRPGPKGQTPERENAIMAGFASTLSVEDMKNVAAYYATQKINPSFAQRKELIAQGQNIYRAGIPGKNVPACAGCHGPNGKGMPAQFPSLSGQHATYTAAQLTNFRAGLRKNSAQMTAVSAQLNDQEINAVAEYLAGLR